MRAICPFEGTVDGIVIQLLIWIPLVTGLWFLLLLCIEAILERGPKTTSGPVQFYFL